jgi:hypothetical protein
MNTTLSLTGKQYINPINLTGKSLYNNGNSSSSPSYNLKIKRVIFDRFITPILTKNWQILKENMFQMNDIMKRLDNYYNNTKDETLIVYKYILNVIKTSFETNEELNTLEGKIFIRKDLAKMAIKIPRIRLRPELELYNLIIGKPENNAYDTKIVDYISNLLKKEYITFKEIDEKIKKFIN